MLPKKMQSRLDDLLAEACLFSFAKTRGGFLAGRRMAMAAVFVLDLHAREANGCRRWRPFCGTFCAGHDSCPPACCTGSVRVSHFDSGYDIIATNAKLQA